MTDIPISSLLPIQAAWQAAINSLSALISRANASPSGTIVLAPATTTLTDITGAVWGFGTTTQGGGTSVQKNGTNVGGGVKIEIDLAGVIWVYNNAGAWYMWTGGGWTSETAGPST